MDKQLISFFGNVSFVGETAGGLMKVVIGGREALLRRGDPGVSKLKVASGSKKTFLVLGYSPTGPHQVVAVYNHPKADVRLTTSLQPVLCSGRVTREDLEDWDPDYLFQEVEG